MATYVINEAFLGQVEALQLLIKNNTAGLYGGNHQSKTFGSSCEFSDYRDYMPGDDITKIDWNAYARFDRLYQKLFLDERQLHTRIYIDASRSMEHGKHPKSHQALRIAATIAYLSICEMDRVSVYAIHGDRLEEIIHGMLGKDAFYQMIGRLNDITFSEECHIPDAIRSGETGKGDGLSVLISDFLTDDPFEEAVHHLCDKKRDVLCIQLLSKEETNPQIRGKHHLFDSENAEYSYRDNVDREIIAAYKKALDYAKNRVKEVCEMRGAGYVFAHTDDSMGHIFFDNMVSVEVLK